MCVSNSKNTIKLIPILLLVASLAIIPSLVPESYAITDVQREFIINELDENPEKRHSDSFVVNLVIQTICLDSPDESCDVDVLDDPANLFIIQTILTFINDMVSSMDTAEKVAEEAKKKF